MGYLKGRKCGADSNLKVCTCPHADFQPSVDAHLCVRGAPTVCGGENVNVLKCHELNLSMFVVIFLTCHSRLLQEIKVAKYTTRLLRGQYKKTQLLFEPSWCMGPPVPYLFSKRCSIYTICFFSRSLFSQMYFLGHSHW